MTTICIYDCQSCNCLKNQGKNMKMHTKIITVILVTIFAFNFSLASDQSGKVRTFKNVEGIALLGSGDAKIMHGNKNEIVIHAPADLIPYLTTKVENGTLKIGKRKNGWKKFRYFHEDIKYNITVKDIDHLKISGSGDITADKLEGNNCKVTISGSGEIDVEKIETDKLDINLSGSGDIDINNLRTENIDAGISGSGDIEVVGKTDRLQVSIAGSGDFDAPKLKSKNAIVDIYGSGDASFSCSENLEAHITGSGDVTCYGDPSLKSRSTGSGTVIIQ